jgi:hypothetical protein
MCSRTSFGRSGSATSRVGEQDRVDERRRDAPLPLRERHGLRVVERLEDDGELVDPRAIVARALGIVAAVGQHIERARVAGRRAHPRLRIGCDGGAGAERLLELVAQIGGQPSNPDQRLVDENEIADGDGFGTTRSRYRRKPCSQRQKKHR